MSVRNFQGGLQLFAGVFMLILGLELGGLLPTRSKEYFPGISGFKKLVGNLFNRVNRRNIFGLGLVLGFIPCGLVYVAIAGAIASGDAISGAAVMMLFGFGTVPAMFAATVFGKFINIGLRTKLRKATPYFAIVLAVIFILRGMNLGIPYLSPKLSNQNATTEEMCH